MDLTAERVRQARTHFYFPYQCEYGHRQNGAPHGKCLSCDTQNIWPAALIAPGSLEPLPQPQEQAPRTPLRRAARRIIINLNANGQLPILPSRPKDHPIPLFLGKATV